jgi:hypothetical protein
VQREVLVFLDESQDAAEAPLGREHVVLARDAWAGGVEGKPQARQLTAWDNNAAMHGMPGQWAIKPMTLAS